MNWITKIIKASEKIKTAFHKRATKEDIAKIWNEVYGENIADEYGGFFDSIKENLEASKKLEEINKVEEVKADGYSISDDEDDTENIGLQWFEMEEKRKCLYR